MQIAFYAPLKPPSDPSAEDSRDAPRFLITALARAGHSVDLVSTFSSYDDGGDPDRQAALREEGNAIAVQLVRDWRNGSSASLPELWVTHHVYYKAPDWLGPRISAELNIPYVIAEASHAPRRAGGQWAIGHDAAVNAIRRADLVLCPTRRDEVTVAPLVFSRERVRRLPPFLDSAPFHKAAEMREEYRAALAEAFGLDAGVPWITAVEAIEPGDKAVSYRALVAALSRQGDLPWRLLIAGDGAARAEIEAHVHAMLPGRASFLGALTSAELPPVHAVADLSVWPAINESYGRSHYEAQAAGVAIVSSAPSGVPESVSLGRTGIHTQPGDSEGLAQAVRELLVEPQRRTEISRAAMSFIAEERSIDAIAQRLGREFLSVFGKT